MKIIADSNIPYINGVLDRWCDVVRIRGAEISRSDVADADALLIRTRTRCDASLLSGSTVRLIATATIGTDHIDLDWCRDNGIEVVSAIGGNSGGVLQWVSATLAALAAEGGWTPEQKTIGIVGVGHAGSLVERYARQWGFRVLCSDPPRQRSEGLSHGDGFVPLDELAAQSDIVTFHVPLTHAGTDPTAGLGGGNFFAHLKKGASVLNCARGGIVDEAALLTALHTGAVGNCCVDTWQNEPNIDSELLARAFIATPHIAGYSAQGKANVAAIAVNAIARKFALPLTDWYPAEVVPAVRRAITWSDMCDSIAGYCDLAGETTLLQSSPDRFEQMREGYSYREEYF